MDDGRFHEAPLVSVVIPVYNVRKYLRKCLDSVTGQTYRNLEIILIDDGSSDGSGTICDEYASRDARIAVLHTENNGISSARNLGLEKAGGSCLLFVDGDDWIEAKTVELFVQTALREDASVVTAERYREFSGKTVPPGKKESGAILLRGREILDAYAGGAIPDNVWNKLYRRDCFSGVRFPDGHNYEDVAVTPMLLKTLAKHGCTVAVLSEPLYHFRMRRGSISHTRSYSNIVDSWNAVLRKYDLLPEYREQLLPSCCSIINRMWANYSGFSKEEKETAKDTVRQMQAFSRDHFRQIMRENHGWAVKAAALVSLFKSPGWMWVCSRASRIYLQRREKSNKLFD